MTDQQRIQQLVVDGDLDGLKELEEAGVDVNTSNGFGFFHALLEGNVPLADWFFTQSRTRLSLRALFAVNGSIPSVLVDVIAADRPDAVMYLLATVPELVIMRDHLLPSIYYLALSTGSVSTAACTASALPDQIVHDLQCQLQTARTLAGHLSLEELTDEAVA